MILLTQTTERNQMSLNVNHTTQSYSGKPGCMCGCRGTYNETERARKMALTSLQANPNVRLDMWSVNGVEEGCLFVETETRTRCVYLNAEGCKEASKMGFLYACSP